MSKEDQWQARYTAIQRRLGAPGYVFHRHWNILRQQTLEASPEMQTNIKAKIQMDGIVYKDWLTLVNF